jgi:nucleotide-binding universal stress UspA family protein
MDRRIILAYDGSINADWVSRYAIQMAAILPSRQLILVHILDGTFSREKIEGKFTTIAAECDRTIAWQHLILEKQRVYATLLGSSLRATELLSVQGTDRSERRGFLAAPSRSSSSAAGQCRLSGWSGPACRCPRTLLSPRHPGFSGRHAFPADARLLSKGASPAVMTVNPFHFRYISQPLKRRSPKVPVPGMGRCEIVSRPGSLWHFDHHVVLSDDWAKEIFIQAGKLNADMVLLGASEHGLSHRFFHGNRIERILNSTACDVGIYRKL